MMVESGNDDTKEVERMAEHSQQDSRKERKKTVESVEDMTGSFDYVPTPESKNVKKEGKSAAKGSKSAAKEKGKGKEKPKAIRVDQTDQKWWNSSLTVVSRFQLLHYRIVHDYLQQNIPGCSRCRTFHSTPIVCYQEEGEAKCAKHHYGKQGCSFVPRDPGQPVKK